MVLTLRQVCCRVIQEGVWRFLVMEVVLVWQMMVVEIDYEYESKCENRRLFCLHLDNISELLFCILFCDG